MVRTEREIRLQETDGFCTAKYLSYVRLSLRISRSYKESSMESPHRFAWAITLLWLIGSSLSADDSPTIPDRYAEVVLRVEGMI